MATRIQDLPDEHLLATYHSWYASDISNWSIGRALLPEISRRFGARFERQFYLDGLRRIVAIKPSVKGREHSLFPPDFIIPLPEIIAVVAEMTRDVGIAVIEDQHSHARLSLRYEVPVIPNPDDFSRVAADLLGDRSHSFSDMRERTCWLSVPALPSISGGRCASAAIRSTRW